MPRFASVGTLNLDIRYLHVSTFNVIRVMKPNIQNSILLLYVDTACVCVYITQYVGLPPCPQDVTGNLKTVNLLLKQNSHSLR